MKGFLPYRRSGSWQAGCMLALTAVLLTGCWNKYELTELGFVMGVAIDSYNDGAVQLTTQIYMPQQSGDSGGSRGEDSNINVVTTDSSNLQAARGIAGELGRRAQWSHMRVILVSEEMARKEHLGQLLDLFYRDPEPRLTASILITKGSARSYMEKRPTIEQTTSQQIKRSEEASADNAARTINSDLLELGKQMRSATGNAVIAYIVPDTEDARSFRVNGSALIHGGKMVARLSVGLNRGLLMLTDRYVRGAIDVPCGDVTGSRQTMVESFEVSYMHSRIKPKLVDDRLEVTVTTEVKGSVTELKCSTITSREGEAAFIARTEEAIRSNMEQTFERLQELKLDVLQLGNHIYRHDPQTWYRVKPEWGDYFAHAKLKLDVHVKMNTTGTMIGEPVFE